ncbi:MAG: hydrogenase iron-sulfur subunit [Deltaproteobacteria bacterium]|nr:MAG: hydrogenase iron-sulfur subunit [Deltaproteobacteria bacterium]
MVENIRIGVFVCDCGSNIAGVVNVPDVVDYARGLDHVVLADEGRWSCSVDYLSKMQDLIKEHQINRVVVASCTPRTHEPLFKRTVKEAGVNPYLLEFVSIREQVSWVHMQEPEIATEKAKDLVKMGVAKAALLEEGQEIRLPVKTDCLIIGGGMAGMSAALNVADQGFNAVLVEKEPQLGGIMNQLCFISHDHYKSPAAILVESKAAQVHAHPNVTVYTDTHLETVEGYIGNYRVTLKPNGDGSSGNIDVSTVVVATGMQELEPEGQFLYGDDPRVVTQLQLDRMLRDKAVQDVKSVVIINCVNSKNETRGCCSIGCHTSVKNAIALKTLHKNASVQILYRDLSMVKEEGDALEKAKKIGIKFLRFPDDRYPVVATENKNLIVQVFDLLIGKEFKLPADLVVLTTAFKGDETVEHIKGLLKVSSNADGFFQESHVKLGPLEFPADGISLCGCAKAPMTFKESCEAGTGAAMKVSIPMKRGYVEAEGIVADIDLANCNQCSICWKRCPYSAIKVDAEKNPEVIKALCKGCGLCAADCPKECISIVHYSDEQVMAQVEAALEDDPDRKIIGFVCHWCALGGVDMAGVSRLQYPSNARLIRVMCSARVSIKMMQHAFDLGAAGVLVAGCEFPTCHYITGNYAAEKRIKRTKSKLAKAGYDPERLWNIWCSAADGPKFAGTMREMVKELNLK